MGKSERNDRNRYPDGAYIDIEHHLLRLALVSEVAPRANKKYVSPPPPVPVSLPWSAMEGTPMSSKHSTVAALTCAPMTGAPSSVASAAALAAAATAAAASFSSSPDKAASKEEKDEKKKEETPKEHKSKFCLFGMNKDKETREKKAKKKKKKKKKK